MRQMGIYKSKFGITAVHSYSRYYYQKENNLSKGNEGSWTIRDSAKVSSFCVFHNGNQEQPSQIVKLNVYNQKKYFKCKSQT